MSLIEHEEAVPYGVGMALSARYVADREAGSTLTHIAWLEAEVHAVAQQLAGAVEALRYFAIDESAFDDSIGQVAVAVTREHAAKLRAIVGSNLD